MDVLYKREDDILLIEIAPQAPIDHAEQAGPIIVHFSPEDEIVLIEVLFASQVLRTLVEAGLKGRARLMLSEGAIG